MKYTHIIYIGDEDKYSLFFNKYCRDKLVNSVNIINIDKDLVHQHKGKINYKFDYKKFQMDIQNALIITQEDYLFPENIQQEINRIFFPGKIRTNQIVVENQYTLDRIFNVTTADKNDRATNRFELMEID